MLGEKKLKMQRSICHHFSVFFSPLDTKHNVWKLQVLYEYLMKQYEGYDIACCELTPTLQCFTLYTGGFQTERGP